MNLNWQHIDTAPKDGTVIWAYLNETGIRRVRYLSPEEIAMIDGGDPSEYDGTWVEEADEDEDWNPRFWLPLDAIPVPAEAA